MAKSPPPKGPPAPNASRRKSSPAAGRRASQAPRGEFSAADLEKEELAVPPKLRGPRPSRSPASVPTRDADDDEQTRLGDEPEEAPAPIAAAPEPSPAESKASAPVKFPPPPKPAIPRTGLYALLDEAQDIGVYFAPAASVPGDASAASPYVAAVQQARRKLGALKGVQDVGPGRDAQGTDVVLVTTEPGLTEAALRDIPPEIQGFKTLVVIPFESLPLRRDRDAR